MTAYREKLWEYVEKRIDEVYQAFQRLSDGVIERMDNFSLYEMVISGLLSYKE